MFVFVGSGILESSKINLTTTTFYRTITIKHTSDHKNFCREAVVAMIARDRGNMYNSNFKFQTQSTSDRA